MRFIAKQEQETPNWKRKTIKRMTMYWKQEVKETALQNWNTQQHHKHILNSFSYRITLRCN